MKYNIDNITGLTNPKYVGGYKLGKSPYCMIFNFTKKPCWFHRKMTKLLLGWEWVDIDE